LGHLGLIVSDAAYALVVSTGENAPIRCINTTFPGQAPVVIDQGTAAQLSAVRESWVKAVLAFRMFNTVQQALKKQIITVFEPMYLDILNDNMIGSANITAREILDQFFLTYDSIAAVDL
jgi:hypothetical protein